MKKKERLGSDPLDFMNDNPGTSGEKESGNQEEPPGKTSAAKTVQKEKPRRNVEKTRKPSDITKPSAVEKEEKAEASNTPKMKNLAISTVEKKGKTPVVSFEGEMTIYAAREIMENIMTRLEESERIDIDLSGVSRMDTSAFQTLLLAKREAEEKDKPFTIINPSAEVKDIFKLYGEGL